MAKNVKKKVSPKKARLPLPKDVPPTETPTLPKAVKRAEMAHLLPFAPPQDGDATVLDRLWATVEQRRQSGDTLGSHSARLLARGTPKVAQKLGEEAVELVIEAVAKNREATISESADVLYHLMVLWVDAGIRPEQVWGELRRREGISGIVEKASRPKALLRIAATTKLP
jgi:phosphoribosyl-ATP pyrophosphohydrolase